MTHIFATSGTCEIFMPYIYAATGGAYTIQATDQWNYTVTGTPAYVTSFSYDMYYSSNRKDHIRELIRSNLLIKGSRPRNTSVPETKAQETLRDMITERDWRRYITNGFIMVRGQSDFQAKEINGPLWYQIFADKRVQVFKDNVKIGAICIHSDRSVPPTDHVISMKILVELDEANLWAGGNYYGAQPKGSTWDLIATSVDAQVAKMPTKLVDVWKKYA